MKERLGNFRRIGKVQGALPTSVGTSTGGRKTVEVEPKTEDGKMVWGRKTLNPERVH